MQVPLNMLSPGIAPNIIPANAPIEIAIITSKVPIKPRAAVKFSIKKFHLLVMKILIKL